MAVNPVKTVNSFAITNSQEARDDRQRDAENKNSSKNRKKLNENQARPEAANAATEPKSDLESELNSQPIDTEKVLELLALKEKTSAHKAQLLKLTQKRVKKLDIKKLDKLC